MTKDKDKTPAVSPIAAERPDESDSLGSILELEVPAGVDRRTFLMRSALVGATAVMTGRTVAAQEKIQQATLAPPKLDPSLNVVKKAKLPVMTLLDEFYKVGPGPSSSHT